jgi:hypothetical protein
VRLSKARIRARIKRDLPLEYAAERISAHGGLELFRRYLVQIDFAGRVRRTLRGLSGRGSGGSPAG